jgi:hypothetical protein
MSKVEYWKTASTLRLPVIRALDGDGDEHRVLRRIFQIEIPVVGPTTPRCQRAPRYDSCSGVTPASPF